MYSKRFTEFKDSAVFRVFRFNKIIYTMSMYRKTADSPFTKLVRPQRKFEHEDIFVDIFANLWLTT